MRLFLWMTLLILLTITAFELFAYDGQMIIIWMGYRLQTSLVAALIVLLVSIAILFKLWQLWQWIKSSPLTAYKTIKMIQGRKYVGLLTQALAKTYCGSYQESEILVDKVLSVKEEIDLCYLIKTINHKLAHKDDLYQKSEALLAFENTQEIGLYFLIEQLIQTKELDKVKSFIEDAKKKIGIKPWLIKVQLDLAEKEFKYERYLEILEKHKNILDYSLEDFSQKISNIHWLLGKQYFSENKLDKAVEHLNDSLKFDKTNLNSILLLAESYKRNSKKKAAIKLLKNSWEDTQNKQLLTAYGNIFPKAERQELLAELQELRLSHPSNADINLTIAKLFVEDNKFTEAREYLNEALHYNGESHELLALMIQTELAKDKNANIDRWLNRLKNIAS